MGPPTPRRGSRQIDLSTLQFGAPSAERDIPTGLASYFIESDAYRRVSAGDKRILLGNRGAGKSAIFKILAAKEKLAENVVLELAPEDYSYQMFHDVLAKEGEGAWAKSGAYAAAWKYLMLVLIMKQLSRHAKAKNRANSEEKKMFRYLRDNFMDGALNPLGVLISYIKRMEALKIGKYEAGIKTRELTRLYKLEELEPYIATIVSLAQKVQVSIFVDELDQGWDASEDAQAFVAGLFQACNSINRLSPRLRVFVSLRQELYENIPAIYDDAQKYRDLFQHIVWNQDNLFKLLINRIKFFVPSLANYSPDECWNVVFAEKSSFRFMLDRTLYRPREIISFATEALDYARSQGNRAPISQDAIRVIEPAYSRTRFVDLESEYRFQYPDLQSVLNSFRGKKVSWSRRDLEDFCVDLAISCSGLTDNAKLWVGDRDPDALIDILWRVGFIRIRASRPTSPSYGQYLPGSADDPTVSLSSASEFMISPLFRSTLGLHV